MALLDHIGRLPGLRSAFRRIIGTADNRAGARGAGDDRPEVMRQFMQAFDTAEWGSSRASWLNFGTDQPYETDSRLIGEKLPWEIRRILTSDAKVQMVVRAIVTTALTAEWSARPGRDTPLARKLAEQQNQDFGWGGRSPRLDRAWDEIVEEALFIGPAVGFCYHEAAYALRPVDGALRWQVADYLYRPPEAHEEFLYEGDVFVGVRQRSAGGFSERVIPSHRLLLLGYGAGPDNLWGTGWARAAYPWVVLKEHFTELLALNGEREALGGLHVKVDKKEAEAHGYTTTQLAKMIETAKQAAAEWSRGTLAWLMSAGGIDFQKLPGGYPVTGALAIITQCNQEILAACVGAPLLEMGVVQPGNRAIGEIFGNFLVDNVANVLDQQGRRLGGRLGPGRGTATRVHDVNEGRLLDPADYPVAVHKGLRLSKLAQALGQLPALRAANLLTPTDKLEADVREAVGIAQEGALQTIAERLGGANNAVPNLGPAGTPDGAPASPTKVAAAVGRLQGAGAANGDGDVEALDEDTEDAEADDALPVDPAACSAANRTVADTLNISTGLLNSLVARGRARGIPPPAIGAGRYRRWDPAAVGGWYHRVTSPDTDLEGAA